MFDRYMLVENTLAPLPEGVGFQLGIRFPHHCGIWLSIVEELTLAVDGEAIPPQAMTLTLHGNTYRVDSLQQEGEDRWNFAEIGTLAVHTGTPLTPGTHTLTLRMGLRVSFLAWLLAGEDTKQMTLQSTQQKKEEKAL